MTDITCGDVPRGAWEVSDITGDVAEGWTPRPPRNPAQ